MGHLPPNNQSGLKQSATDATESRRNPRLKLPEDMKREQKNGARNTSHKQEKETSLKKGRSYWKTKTNGGTRHPYSKNATNPERGRELMKTRDGSVMPAPPERTNHVNLHSRLVPLGGGGKRGVGRMDDDDLGKVTRPKENAASDFKQLTV